jgi:hypothetical protein
MAAVQQIGIQKNRHSIAAVTKKDASGKLLTL